MSRSVVIGALLLASVSRAEKPPAAVAVSGALLSREQGAELMRTLEPEALVALGQDAVRSLGTYTYRMVKRERVGGRLLPADEIQVFVRERPPAVRLHFLKGPAAGRKVAFDPAVRPDELRVREPGVLSYTGAWWIGVDSPFAKMDSNHTIREAGLGALLKRFARDQAQARPLGGYRFTHEGWNERGLWCTMLTAPNEGRGFDAPSTRICNDVERKLPMKVETFALNGDLLESYEMWDVRPYRATQEFFLPEKL